MTENEKHPWDRLPHEHINAYEAFCFYRDLGPKRSYQEVAKRFNKSYDWVKKKAAKFDWKKRTEAYIEHLNNIQIELEKEEIKKMAEKHIRLSQMYQQALLKPVIAFIKRLSKEMDPLGENADFGNLTIDKLYDKVVLGAQVLPKIIDIERKSRGEPINIEKSDVNSTEQIRVILPIVPKFNTLSNYENNDS